VAPSDGDLAADGAQAAVPPADETASAAARTAEPEQGTGRAAQRSLWRNRDYLCLWTGDAVSSLGTSMSTIAYPLLILFATGSVARAGLITAANMIGMLVTTLWGGALADRVSRKALLILSPLLQAAAVGTVAAFVLGGRTPIPLLAAAAAVGGLASGFRNGARTPAMRRIVPKEQMAVASSQVQGRDLAAELFGSPLGGLLFTITRWLPFGADAVSFLFSAAGAALIRRPLGPEPLEGERESMLADIRAGLRYVRRVPFLRFLATWAPAINMIATGYFLLFIAVLKYRGADPTTIGLVNSVAMIGGVTGAVAGPAVLKRVRAKLVFLAAGWTLTATMLLTAVLPEPWEISLAVFLVMLLIVPLNAALEAYMVRLVPDELSGRVGAAVSFGAQALQWVGPLLAGLLADALGPPGAVLVFAAALVPLAALAHLVRSLDLLDVPVEQVQEFRLPGDAVAS
jgi:MFS family permease